MAQAPAIERGTAPDGANAGYVDDGLADIEGHLSDHVNGTPVAEATAVPNPYPDTQEIYNEVEARRKERTSVLEFETRIPPERARIIGMPTTKFYRLSVASQQMIEHYQRGPASSYLG